MHTFRRAQQPYRWLLDWATATDERTLLVSSLAAVSMVLSDSVIGQISGHSVLG